MANVTNIQRQLRLPNLDRRPLQMRRVTQMKAVSLFLSNASFFPSTSSSIVVSVGPIINLRRRPSIVESGKKAECPLYHSDFGGDERKRECDGIAADGACARTCSEERRKERTNRGSGLFDESFRSHRPPSPRGRDGVNCRLPENLDALLLRNYREKGSDLSQMNGRNISGIRKM